MSNYSRLLKKQLKKAFGAELPSGEKFEKFFQLIDDTYSHYENDRKLLERAMTLSSQELMEANSDLIDERTAIKKAVKSIEDSIKVLAKSEPTLQQHQSVDLSQDSKEIIALAQKLRDLAEQHIESEKELLDQKERMAEAQQLANFGNWIFDTEAVTTDWSDQMFRIYDWDPSQKAPNYRTYLTMIHHDDRKKAMDAFNSLEELGVVTTEFRVVLKEKTKWVRTTFKNKIDEDSGHKLIFGTAIDITAQKQAELTLAEKLDEIEQTNIFLDTLFSNLPLLLFVKDATTRKYLVRNKAGAKMVGIENKDIIGKTVWDVFPKHMAKLYDDQDNAVLESGEMLEDPIEPLFLEDGTKRYLHTKKVPLKDLKGNVKYILTISEDVTDRVLADEQVRMAAIAAEEANRAKSSFLSSMSHELRTPLNAIIGFSQILRRDKKLPEQQRSYIETMYKSGNHLLEMINDVLDISKIESGRFEMLNENFNLHEMLRDVHSMFRLKAEAKNIRLQLIIDSALPEIVHSDAKRIQQVLINLVGNAVKFTENGKVTISAEAETIPHSSALSVQFSVSDTGRGIPDDQINSIFEPFRQVKGLFNEGTGLGLAISSRIAELLDGRIQVVSTLGNGSTFTFEIPIQPAESHVQNVDDEYLPVESIVGDKQYRILVVDDIPSNRAVVRTLLQMIGFEVIEAENGRDAVVMTKMLKPDLVFMDIMMPVMDGIRSLYGIRKDPDLAHIPIVALTASGSKQRKSELKEAGFDDYIPKPFREKWIIDALKEHLKIEFKHKLEESEFTSNESNSNSLQEMLPWLKKLSDSERKILSELAMTNDFDGLGKWLGQLNPSSEKEAIQKMIDDKNHLFFIELSDKLDMEE